MNPKTIHYQISYTATLTTAQPSRVQVWFTMPKNEVNQKITHAKISPQPHKKYSDANQNKIYAANLSSPATISLQFAATLSQAQANFISKHVHTLKRTDVRRYTKSERYLEQTAELQKLAQKITGKTASTPAKLYALTSWIKRNFTYHYPVLNRGVANMNLTKPTGDCGEAGALFVTLCRSLGIPAVNKTGYVMYHDELGKLYEHAWTSVFTSELGWIHIDPRAGNITKHGSHYVYTQKNYLLNFSTGYSLPLKPAIKPGANVEFWKKVGLPHTNKSVQVLQPLFFCAPQYVRYRINHS